MGAVQSAPATVISQLLKVTKAPINVLDIPGSTFNTIDTLLWYNLMSTDDGRKELHHGPYTDNQGNPFDNKHRKYTGSANDGLLNAKVKRFKADKAAVNESLYFIKVLFNKTNPKSYTNLTSIRIARYGHCIFASEELQLAFYRLLGNTGGLSMTTYLYSLPNQASQERFKKLVQKLGNESSVDVNDK